MNFPDGVYYPMEYTSTESNTPFVYSISFVGHNPVGTCALVVARTSEQAKKALLNHLFAYDIELSQRNTIETLGTKVFCQADKSQLGKVLVVLDGVY